MPLYRIGVTKRIRRARRFVRSMLATVNRRPVIVLGKEKSGTTAIAALLAAHTGCSLTRDIQALWGAVEARIRGGELELGEIVRRNRGAFASDIIKEPNLTLLYPQIREVFPEARVVMIVRDPRDNIRSVLNRLDVPGTLTPAEASAWLERVGPAWRPVFEGDSDGFRRATYIEVAASRWNTAADAYLAHKDEMVLLRYEDFVREKAGTIAWLADAMALPHVHDISRKVDVQYQPRGDRMVSWADFFGADHLSTIDRICGPRMRLLGYEPAVGASVETTSCPSV